MTTPTMATPDWLPRCDADRIHLLGAAERHREAPVGRPAEALDEVIEEVLGFGLMTRPVWKPILGFCCYRNGLIIINSRMPELVRPNTDIDGLTYSTKAHELAHLCLPHHEVERQAARRRGHALDAATEARQEAEANSWASVFLVPSDMVLAMPSVMALVDAQCRREETAYPSEVLWTLVVDLARWFRVTGGMMARRLAHLGILEHIEGRRLRLVVRS